MARPRVRSSSPGPSEAEIDRLYALPLGEFIRTRNALAARLKKVGQADEAEAARRLQKPTPPVWAINHAARHDPDAVERFIEAVERLREAQAARPGEIEATTEAQRAALGQLIERARTALTGAGFSGSPEMAARLTGTLLGAAVEQPGDLRRGRLTEERPAPGFEVLAGVPRELAGRPDEKPVPPRRREGESAAARGDRARRQRAQEALEVARADAAEWQRRASDLERATEEHRRLLADAEAAAKELRQRLTEAEERVGDERRAAEQARRETERAEQEAKRADARLKAAERALRGR